MADSHTGFTKLPASVVLHRATGETIICWLEELTNRCEVSDFVHKAENLKLEGRPDSNCAFSYGRIPMMGIISIRHFRRPLEDGPLKEPILTIDGTEFECNPVVATFPGMSSNHLAKLLHSYGITNFKPFVCVDHLARAVDHRRRYVEIKNMDYHDYVEVTGYYLRYSAVKGGLPRLSEWVHK